MTETSADRPSLVVVSAVYPFPGASGQQLRVRNKLMALKEHFRLSFLTFAPREQVATVTAKIEALGVEPIVLPSRYQRTLAHRLSFATLSFPYALLTGLKRSNFLVGRVELTPQRLEAGLHGRVFDVALFEYWHAHRSASVLARQGTLTVLDMHDLLWRSYERQLAAKPWVAPWLACRRVAAYRRTEEAAWRDFDVLITINRDEHEEARRVLGTGCDLVYAPMGVDLDRWRYLWHPLLPPRFAYYGGLGSPHNQEDALHCATRVMPKVWEEIAGAELWFVGSDPPPRLRELAERDPRIHVSGFVADPGPLLASMTAVLCPWSGTYGFRSRLAEVMAVGTPVVASADAISGMELRPGLELLVADDAGDMAEAALLLNRDGERAAAISQAARRRIEESYSFAATYGTMAKELLGICERKLRGRVAK